MSHLILPLESEAKMPIKQRAVKTEKAILVLASNAG